MKKILIILLAGLGDMVLVSPALRALRSKFPDSEIDLLILAENEELGRNCPYVNDVFVFNRSFSCKSFFKSIETILRLRKKFFDIAINLYTLYTIPGAFKIWAMLFLIDPKQTLGRNTNGKGFFYDLKIEDSLGSKKHQVECMLAVVKILGAEDEDRQLEVWYSKDKEASVMKFLSAQGITDKDIIIGINPGASRNIQCWPVEKFAALSELIINKYHAKIIITGNKQELKLAEEIKKRVGQSVIITSGIFDLSELTSLIKLCRIYITNDTGPMHIANALGVPLVVLEGGDPETTYPFIKDKVSLVRKEIDCRPCYGTKCRRQLLCLESIAPRLVMKSIDTLMGGGETVLPLKVIVITEVLYPDLIGGAGRYVQALSIGLVKRGEQVTIITRHLDDLPKREEEEKVTIFRVDWGRVFALFRPFVFWFSLQRAISRIRMEEPADIIFFNQPFSAFFALLSKDIGTAKKIYNFQSSWADELEIMARIKDLKWYCLGRIIKRWLYRPILFLMSKMEGSVLRKNQRIIVLSQFSKDRIIELYSIPSGKIEVIPPAIDTGMFVPNQDKKSLRRKFNLSPNDFILITVRNLVPRMGIDNLIIAFKEVVKKHPRAYLIIVGGGFMKKKLKLLAKKLNLIKNINFAGSLKDDELFSYYRLADLFILPTRYLEGFGLVTLEAMASGLPVLGTPVGGTVEILSKFDQNFLFADSSPQSMAKKILEFMNSKPDMIQLAKRCREFVLQEYSQEKWLNRMENFLRK